MIAKRIRTTAVVKSDYDRNASNYDLVRFGTPADDTSIRRSRNLWRAYSKDQESLRWELLQDGSRLL